MNTVSDCTHSVLGSDGSGENCKHILNFLFGLIFVVIWISNSAITICIIGLNKWRKNTYARVSFAKQKTYKYKTGWGRWGGGVKESCESSMRTLHFQNNICICVYTGAQVCICVYLSIYVYTEVSVCI